MTSGCTESPSPGSGSSRCDRPSLADRVWGTPTGGLVRFRSTYPLPPARGHTSSRPGALGVSRSAEQLPSVVYGEVDLERHDHVRAHRQFSAPDVASPASSPDRGASVLSSTPAARHRMSTKVVRLAPRGTAHAERTQSGSYERLNRMRRRSRNGTIRTTARTKYRPTASLGRASPTRIAITYPARTGQRFRRSVCKSSSAGSCE